MTLDDRMRLRLLPKLEELFGAEEADALMDEFSHPDWGDLATKADLRELSVELRGEMAELRAEMHDVIRSQTWHLVTFVCAFNAVLVAVCSVVVATLV